MSARISDLAVVFGVAVIIGLIIVPVPEFMLDALIAVNIALGVTMLTVAIYLSSPTQFPVFPSILLIGTVYRLALSIAATRMILTDAHAGRIIETFGQVAAGGNLVVGLVVFVVITAVQFIVIAKGAERVAEVAARFSLDAMPGKQMSIDSDLRSGIIDKDEARRRRRMLELESRLHGSLDGAMKFIKGDAVAGIFILVVNLVGGMAVGLGQRHLPLGDAVQTYSVLTIGDGMVAQIPALLFALSAGLVVTRTADEDDDAHLGEAIRQQLSRLPRALLIVGILCCALSLVPGFPTIWFLALGAGGLLVGVMLDPSLRAGIEAQGGKRGWLPRRSSTMEGTVDSPSPSIVHPLQLSLIGDAARVSTVELDLLLADLLTEFERRLGFALPEIRYQLEPAHPRAEWRLLAFDVVIGHGALPGDNRAKALGLALRACLRRHIGSFLGMQETCLLLERAAATHPEATREAGRVLSVLRIAEVLRALVEEEVSLRGLPLVVEALAEAGQKDKDSPTLIALARLAIHRHIVQPYAPDGDLKALSLSPALERQLRSAVTGGAAAPVIGLEPAAARALIDDLAQRTSDTGAVALVAPIDLRRPLRKLIEPELFDLPVFAYNELKPPLTLSILDSARSMPSSSVEAAA